MSWLRWMAFGAVMTLILGTTACSDADNANNQDGDLEDDARGEPETESGEGGDQEPAIVCPVAGDLGVGEHTIDLEYGGLARSYVLYVPSGYDNSVPTPLVLDIPGFKMTAKLEADFTLLSATSDEKGFVIVYPLSYKGVWNTGIPPALGPSGDKDDVGFIRAMMADIPKRLCVDARRVYATGMSAGASMAHRLGCEAAELFAAIAPVSGGLGVECHPSRPLPVLVFHGVQDNLVPYKESVAAVRQWLDVDGCQGEPQRTAYNSSVCETHSDCQGGVSVIFCSMDPMGHCWPGGSEPLCTTVWGPYNNDINADQYIWDFFSRYALP